MAEIGQRSAIHHRASRGAEATLENLHRIGAGDRAHAVEGKGEAAGDLRADGGEIEQAFHQFGIGGDGIDHFDGHVAQLAGADRVDIDIGGFQDFVAVDHQRSRGDGIGHLFRCRTAIADIIFDAEILVRAAGIVAGRQDEAAKGAGRADQVRCGGGGQDAALTHDDATKAVGGGHFQHDLDDFAVEIASVAAHDQRFADKAVEAVEHRLDEIFRIMGLLEDADLLAQAGRARLLVIERRRRNSLNHPKSPELHFRRLMARQCCTAQSSCDILAG